MKSNFLWVSKTIKKKKFIRIKFTNETVEPITIEIGKNRNNKKKIFSLKIWFIQKVSTL